MSKDIAEKALRLKRDEESKLSFKEKRRKREKKKKNNVQSL